MVVIGFKLASSLNNELTIHYFSSIVDPIKIYPTLKAHINYIIGVIFLLYKII